MDLRLNAATPATDEEQAAVASVLGPAGSGWEGGQRTAADGHAAVGGHAARAQRHLLLPVLHAVQERVGWISPGALDHVCARLTIPPAEAYGVASFYALFRTSPSPSTVVHVCDDLACRVNGAEQVCEQMERRFGTEGAAAGANGSGVTWQRSPCLGQCDRGSAALIQQAGAVPARVVLAPAEADQVRPALADGRPARRSAGPAGPAGSRLTAQPSGCCAGWDWSTRARSAPTGRPADTRRSGGRSRSGPQAVIREIKDAKLLGRGGAAFPTAVKWEAVATNPVRPHYVVCNADESEPGTFKDRVLMEEDPYALVEALTIMGCHLRGRAGLHLHQGRVPAGGGQAAARRRAGRRPRFPRLRT